MLETSPCGGQRLSEPCSGPMEEEGSIFLERGRGVHSEYSIRRSREQERTTDYYYATTKAMCTGRPREQAAEEYSDK